MSIFWLEEIQSHPCKDQIGEFVMNVYAYVRYNAGKLGGRIVTEKF